MDGNGPRETHSHFLVYVILTFYILVLFSMTSCTWTNRNGVGPKWDAYRLEFNNNKETKK